MARKTMKTPAPKKLADADLGAVAGASGGLVDLSWIASVTSQSNSLNQVSLGNGNGSIGLGAGGVGNTSQSASQSNSSSTTIVHF